MDEREEAGIRRFNHQVKISQWGKGQGFIWVKTGDLHVYSCYFSPKRTLESFETYLDELEQDFRQRKGYIVLGGDLNAKSTLWSSPTEDARGEVLTDWTSQNNLSVLNTGDRPTFERGNSNSFIDITLASAGMARKMTRWAVLDEETLSLHKYIDICFKYEDRLKPNPWRYGRTDKDRAKRMINSELGVRLLDIRDLMDRLKRISRKSTPRTRNNQIDSAYWWTQELANLKVSCTQSRRRMQRLIKGPSTQVTEIDRAKDEYKEAKRNLKKAILKEKDRCWDDILKDLV